MSFSRIMLFSDTKAINGQAEWAINPIILNIKSQCNYILPSIALARLSRGFRRIDDVP